MLSFGLDLQSRAAMGGAGVPAFDPLTVSPQIWIDPSDLSTMFQTGTRGAPGTAVTADNDPVGLILDKSGGNRDLVQATAGLRPLYKTSGGLHWLQFDGADDIISTGVIAALTAVSDVLVSQQKTGGTRYMAAFNTAGGANYVGLSESGSASATSANTGGAPYVNGTIVSPDQRGALDTASGLTAHVFEQRTTASFSWTQVSFGNYTGGFSLTGKLFGVITAATMSAGNRNSVRTYLGAKAGIVV